MASKKKKLTEQEMFLKAFKKANREIEMERNDGKWVSTHRIWKNKKAYNRKRDRKCKTNYLFFIIIKEIKNRLFYQRPMLYLPCLMSEVHLQPL